MLRLRLQRLPRKHLTLTLPLLVLARTPSWDASLSKMKLAVSRLPLLLPVPKVWLTLLTRVGECYGCGASTTSIVVDVRNGDPGIASCPVTITCCPAGNGLTIA